MATAWIEGVGFWAREADGWPAARALLRDRSVPTAGSGRPNPTGLAANERRRAPDSVLLALRAAEEAVAMSGRPAATLASVFTSAHGDLPIVDALARQLANEPLLLSPTRFHHSVHNAASGYWAIASGSAAPGTALAGFDRSFGVGLLEALAQLAADGAPLLLVACDTEATGLLATVNRSRGLLGAAFALAPQRSAAARWQLEWSLEPTAGPGATAGADPARFSPLAAALATNAMADVLPLLEALAAPAPGGTAELAWPVGASSLLRGRLSAIAAPHDAGPAA